ncbi:MAG: hypothetical protein DMF08_10790 [Verrucomicrobia bacterium]|nr:MAG: hypothetical protein DMF08_10790 [Verrucomicrobiota bacterium]
MLTISVKRLELGAVFQPWILTDEPSGLWTLHGYGKRFVVRADEILTAFLEAERAIHQFAVSLLS